MDKTHEVDEVEEWNCEESEYFMCSAFTWSKDGTKLRIYIMGKKEFIDAGLDEQAELAPEKFVLIEFGGGELERLRQFIRFGNIRGSGEKYREGIKLF